MAKYGISNVLGGTQQSLTSSYQSILGAAASNSVALRRIKIYDIIVGTDGTPADNAIDWTFQRSTSTGTGTTITPAPLDPADAAAVGSYGANWTGEPTITAASNLLFFGLNQRASQRWVANPGYELVVPATNTNGIVGRAKSAGYTQTVTMAMCVDEQ